MKPILRTKMEQLKRIASKSRIEYKERNEQILSPTSGAPLGQAKNGAENVRQDARRDVAGADIVKNRRDD
jgi:hypothetical protein